MTRQQITRTAWRIAWLAILLLHVPAILRLAAGWGEADVAAHGSLGFLGASVALFLVEILFCPLLSLCSTRRRIVVLVLMIALLHAGAIDSAPPIDWAELAASSVSLFVGLLVLALVSRSIRASAVAATRVHITMSRRRAVPRVRRAQSFLSAVPALAPPL